MFSINVKGSIMLTLRFSENKYPFSELVINNGMIVDCLSLGPDVWVGKSIKAGGDGLFYINGNDSINKVECKPKTVQTTNEDYREGYYDGQAGIVNELKITSFDQYRFGFEVGKYNKEKRQLHEPN